MARNRGRNRTTYNRRTKSVKTGILLAVALVFILAIIGSTYSRYVSSGTVNTTGEIAKWNVKIGSTNLSEVEDFELTARSVEGISNENIASGKLAPGQTLVTDSLAVNPAGSEVAIDYILTIGEVNTQGFNTNSTIESTKIMATLDGGEAEEVVLVDGKYTYYESLEDVLAGKKVTFVAHISWTDNGNNSADTENGAGAITSIQVPVEITARQHLEEDGFINYGDTSKTLMAMAAETNPFDELVLKEDITYNDYTEYPTSGNKEVKFADNATFDLAGKTVTAPNGALTYVGDDLTIENGNFVGLISSASGRYGIHLWNNNTNDVSTGVVIQNVTTTGINLYNTEVTLKNVTITMPDDAKFYTIYGNVYSTITIESGTYTAGNNTTALFGYLGSDNTEIGVATEDGKNPQDGFKIYGGTFNTNGKPFCLTSGKHIPPVIYGGTFDCDVTAYVADGHTCTDQGNGTWIVE